MNSASRQGGALYPRPTPTPFPWSPHLSPVLSLAQNFPSGVYVGVYEHECALGIRVSQGLGVCSRVLERLRGSRGAKWRLSMFPF